MGDPLLLFKMPSLRPVVRVNRCTAIVMLISGIGTSANFGSSSTLAIRSLCRTVTYLDKYTSQV